MNCSERQFVKWHGSLEKIRYVLLLLVLRKEQVLFSRQYYELFFPTLYCLCTVPTGKLSIVICQGLVCTCFKVVVKTYLEAV